MVKHTQTIHRQKSTKYLSLFDHFMGLAIKGLLAVSEGMTDWLWEHSEI